MYDSGTCMRMVYRRIRLPAAVTEARNRAVLLIPHQALIHARRIHRPGVDVGESMRGGEFHRIKNAAVVPDFDPRVGPPVKTVTGVAAVIERGSLFKIGATWPQRQLDL